MPSINNFAPLFRSAHIRLNKFYKSYPLSNHELSMLRDLEVEIKYITDALNRIKENDLKNVQVHNQEKPLKV